MVMVAPTAQTEKFGWFISVFSERHTLERRNFESPVEQLNRKVLIITNGIIPKTYIHRSHQMGRQSDEINIGCRASYTWLHIFSVLPSVHELQPL